MRKGLDFWKVILIIMIAIFAITLFPIILASFYTVPVLDDYNFGIGARLSYVSGKSFFLGALESVRSYYIYWQGFFSASFMASIQPFNINVKLYFVSNLIAILGYTWASFYLMKTVLCDIYGVQKRGYLLLSVPYVWISIQLLPSVAEGFYWMDGSLGMVVVALVFLLISLWIKYIIHNESKRKQIVRLVVITLDAVLLSGNSPHFLILISLIMIYSFVFFMLKYKRVLYINIGIELIMIIGFIVSYIAPGNKVRLEQIDFSYSMTDSILLAIRDSISYFDEWSNLAFVGIVIWTIIVWNKVEKKSCDRYINPLLFFGAMFSIYSSQMSIYYYCQGALGAPRHMNYYYVLFVYTMAFSLLNLCCWCARVLGLRLKERKLIHRVGMAIVLSFFVYAGLQNYGLHNVNFIMIGESFAKGEIQSYHDEMSQRLKLYEDESVRDVVVNPLSVYPKCFVGEPLSTDPNYWTNNSTQRYYQKDSVVLYAP